MSCHLMFRMLNVSPGIEVGGQVIQPVVDVVVALRGRRGRLGGAGGLDSGEGGRGGHGGFLTPWNLLRLLWSPAANAASLHNNNLTGSFLKQSQIIER